MKKLFLLYLVVAAADCVRQQHDERIANGDTLFPHPEKLELISKLFFEIFPSIF
jgi:hypothetical protein